MDGEETDNLGAKGRAFTFVGDAASALALLASFFLCWRIVSVRLKEPKARSSGVMLSPSSELLVSEMEIVSVMPL